MQVICSTLILLTLVEVTQGSNSDHGKKKGFPLSRFCHVIYANGREYWNPCYPTELLVCEPVLNVVLSPKVYSVSICKARPCHSNNQCPPGSTCSSAKDTLPKPVAEQCGFLNLYYADLWNKYVNKPVKMSSQLRCSLPGSVMMARKACGIRRALDGSVIRTQACRPSPGGQKVPCSSQYSCHVNILGEEVYLYFCPKPVAEQLTEDEINKDDEQDEMKGFGQDWRHKRNVRDGLRCCN